MCKMSHTNRVIMLIDMDCFYCQVEENLDPKIKGTPIAVVQYNEWRGGGIIAVNYPARDKGVTRHMRGDEAKKMCPEINLVKVPQVRGKADLSKYRDAGKRVADVLQTFTSQLERASVDEAYMDITEIVKKRIKEMPCPVSADQLPNTFVVGSPTVDFVENVCNSREYNESNYKLAVGGVVSEEVRAEVFRVTGYRCSAGVAHNKILAKLVCGLHKPNKQTIIPHEAVPELYRDLPIRKIKSLGGKFGSILSEKLQIEFMGELMQFSQKELAKRVDEKAACWLYNIARGIDTEPVSTRLVSKSIGCCKRFPGNQALLTSADVKHWLGELAEEMAERLEKDLEENNRRAKQMVVSFGQGNRKEQVSGTRTHPLNSYEQKQIFESALKVVNKNCLKADGSYIVTFLGISVGNFQEVRKVNEITSFLNNMRDRKEKQNAQGNGTLEIKYFKEEIDTSKGKLGDDRNFNDIVQDSSRLFENPDLQIEDTVSSPNKEASSKSDSVYSTSTLEDDTDHTDLVYYEEVYPQSIIDQIFLDNDNKMEKNDDSDDSISQELDSDIKELNKIKVPQKPSFFARYFEENVGRDFNTSKVLEDECDQNMLEDNDESIEDDGETVNVVCDKQSCDNLADPDSKCKQHFNGYNGEIQNSCPECGKVIDCLDYQSHMDYHFAINMVKQEAHLYKAESSRPKSTSPVKKPSKTCGEKKRRRENEEKTSTSIVQYFKSTVSKSERDILEETSEECSECHKRIGLEDWEVHMDFHAAKKLHLEMNFSKPKNDSVNAGSTKIKGQKDIKGFFKKS